MDGWNFPQEIPGWLTEPEARALAELARDKRVLEIGTYEGRSTISMAQTARHVDCVDPFDGRGTPDPRDTWIPFQMNLKTWGLQGSVKAFVGTAAEVAPLWAHHRYDLVFLDGDHSYEAVRADIAVARKLLAPGGLIALHDYRRRPPAEGRWDPGVTQAVDELLELGAKVIRQVGTVIVLDPTPRAVEASPPAPVEKPVVFLSLPMYDGRCSLAAAQAYDLFPTRGGCEVVRAHTSSSLLPKNFNRFLATALNLRKVGITHFAMIHDDIAPVGHCMHGWLDTLLGLLREHRADLVSAVSPLKDDGGLTSTAVADDLGDPWLCRRLTMREVYDLPETFGALDVGGPLLLNTGLWVMDLRRPWWDELEDDARTLKLCFDFRNRIVLDDEGECQAQCISEDWLFSQELNRRGAKLLATRKVILEHEGTRSYSTGEIWGGQQTDEVYQTLRAKSQKAKNAREVSRRSCDAGEARGSAAVQEGPDRGPARSVSAALDQPPCGGGSSLLPATACT